MNSSGHKSCIKSLFCGLKKNSKHWAGWLPNVTKIENFFMKNGFIKGSFKKGTDSAWTLSPERT